MRDRMPAVFARAVKKGVKISYGTDAGGYRLDGEPGEGAVATW